MLADRYMNLCLICYSGETGTLRPGSSARISSVSASNPSVCYLPRAKWQSDTVRDSLVNIVEIGGQSRAESRVSIGLYLICPVARYGLQMDVNLAL